MTVSSHLHGHTVTKINATFAAHPPASKTGFGRTGRTQLAAVDPAGLPEMDASFAHKDTR